MLVRCHTQSVGCCKGLAYDEARDRGWDNEVSTARPNLRFPTVCPHCSKESLSALPLDVITAALTNGHKLRLRAECCQEVTWDATEIEREQLREYWLSVTMDE
jgi:hypothetical protein